MLTLLVKYLYTFLYYQLTRGQKLKINLDELEMLLNLLQKHFQYIENYYTHFFCIVATEKVILAKQTHWERAGQIQ